MDEIARHQIDGALDPLELAPDGTGKCAQHGGLARPHIALQQHVTAGEQRHGGKRIGKWTR